MNQQKIIQTIAVMAAGFAATKLLDLTWKAVTGHRPPVNGEEDGSSLREVVMFAAVSGAIAALARAFAGRAAKRFIAKGSVHPEH
ncbi:MAG: DUF4235 domain-containing protein [Salana multivorans]|uniref:DUF4235 domain-containing protein n=1 Tax=Salana multivorans TaxID=120377 RepID=UPI000968938A|nr:DUF4235 domain-containing protein [Salana multivorans]MBN8881642.1 DUF4235 domain-containing protein [Salana multivorans]OJX95437.1 MAG: hypothetical protein BGO96_11445 [Micrococcales bacterium 73-15]